MAKKPGVTKMGNTPLKHMAGNATKTYQPMQENVEKMVSKASGARAGYSPKVSTQKEQEDRHSLGQGYVGGGKGTKTPPHRDNITFHGREPKVISTGGTNNVTSVDSSTHAYKKGPQAGKDMAAGGNSTASPKVRHTSNPGSGY